MAPKSIINTPINTPVNTGRGRGNVGRGDSGRGRGNVGRGNISQISITGAINGYLGSNNDIDTLYSKIHDIVHNTLPKCDSIYESTHSRTSSGPNPVSPYQIGEKVRLLTSYVGNDVVTISLSCNVSVLRSKGNEPGIIPNDLSKRFYSDYNSQSKRTYIPVSHRDKIREILLEVISKLNDKKLDKLVVLCEKIRHIYDNY